MKKSFLIPLLLVASLPVYARTVLESGLYCQSCESVSAAKTFLRESGRGPIVECDSENCFPSPPEVFQIGNGNRVFTLKASRNFAYPHSLNISENNQPLNSASYQALYQTWEEFKLFVLNNNLYQVPPSLPELTNNYGFSPANSELINSVSPALGSGEQCPDVTAAKALTNPKLMDHLFTKARIELAAGLGSYHNRQLSKLLRDSNMTAVNGGIGGTFKGVNVSASVTGNKSNQSLSYIAGFSESEVEASISDMLVFNFDFHGLDSNNIPVLNMKLAPDASRIGGQSLAVLSGRYGTAFIDNACLQASLKQFKNISVGTFSSTEVAMSDIPNIPPGQNKDVSMCRYYFNQPGVYSMTWYAPCDK